MDATTKPKPIFGVQLLGDLDEAAGEREPSGAFSDHHLQAVVNRRIDEGEI